MPDHIGKYWALIDQSGLNQITPVEMVSSGGIDQLQLTVRSLFGATLKISAWQFDNHWTVVGWRHGSDRRGDQHPAVARGPGRDSQVGAKTA